MTVSRVIEKYYSVRELSFLLSISEETIREWVKAGKFGRDVTTLGGSDLRIPASGVNALVQSNRLFKEPEDLGVSARTVGELKRKVKEQD